MTRKQEETVRAIEAAQDAVRYENGMGGILLLVNDAYAIAVGENGLAESAHLTWAQGWERQP